MVEPSHNQKTTRYAHESRGSLLDRIGVSTAALMHATIVQLQPLHIRENLAAISSASSKSGLSSELANRLTISPQETSENVNFTSDGKVGSLLPKSFRTHAYISSASTASLQHDFDIFSAAPTTNLAQLLYGHETKVTTKSRHGKQRGSWLEDGAEVVDLLSDKEAFVDELLGPSVDAEYMENYSESWKLNDVDRISTYRFGNRLTEPPVHHSPSPTNPLNLLPNFDSSYNFVHGDLMISASVEPMNIENETFSRSSADISIANFESWLDVLTRYQDDVWGDMLPLVKEVRAENNIGCAEGETVPVNWPATRRLGMLLGHFNGFYDANRACRRVTTVHWPHYL